MNSLSGDSNERYSIRTSSSAHNPLRESLPCSETENSRYCYNESFAPLSQIDLQQSHASLNQFDDDGLSYIPQDYFQSSSYNPFMTNLHKASTVVSQISSNSQNQPTYASLMPANHHLSINSDTFLSSPLGSSSVRSENCVNSFAFSEHIKPPQSVIGKMTNTLPALKLSPHSPSDLLSGDYLNQEDQQQQNMLSSGKHSSDCQKRSMPNNSCLLSPSYSTDERLPTQGSHEKSLHGFSADERLPNNSYKSRSKKESHNRIERRRRDYINSQIAHLGTLIPTEMYRDGDGRRNKGTVLRLSVQYIANLRHTLSHSSGIHRETSLARLLIPQLLSHANILENKLKEIYTSSNGLIDYSPESYESHLEAWKTIMEANINQTSAACSVSPQSTPENCSRRGRIPMDISHVSSTDIHGLSLIDNSTHISFPSLSARILPSQMQRHNSTDCVPSTQDQHVFLGGSLKPEDLDGDDIYSLVCDDVATIQSKHRGNGENFAYFSNKSNDARDEFFATCEAATFDDLIQMNTDGVETLQPIECRNR